MPQILEEQQALFFHLQQQRLIELIRQGRTEQALAFAQEYLAPHGEENEAFLEELGALAAAELSGSGCFWKHIWLLGAWCDNYVVWLAKGSRSCIEAVNRLMKDAAEQLKGCCSGAAATSMLQSRDCTKK
jgi:hypothetical protein